jgi:peptide/nickel transport system permease protein
MVMFLLRRVLAGLVLVLVVATLTFALLNLTGTDAARNILGENATPEQAAAEAATLGLNRPLPVRYWDWLSHAVRGDLGTSWFKGEAVTSSLASTLPITLSLALAGLLLSALLSVGLGTAAAVRGGRLDRAIQFLAVLSSAAPSFLVGLLLAVTIAVKLRWLPATGYVSFTDSAGGWLRSITLPAIALAIAATGGTAQQVRGSLIDVLDSEYIRLLRSRGISERRVVFKHALRNAAPAGLTVLSLQFIGLIGGAVIIEKIFGLPGVGSLANFSAVQGDQPVVLGVVVVTAAIVVLVNLLIDIAYGWLNPKVRAA